MKQKVLPVMILAGGLATRMRPLTEKVPKAMLDVNDEPFIAHQLRLLKQQGVEEVVLCLGFLGEQVQDYVQNGASFGLNVRYSFDGDKLLGTGGAIKKAASMLKSDFFVMYGDSYLPCDFKAVQDSYIAQQKQALMTVFNNKGQYDTSNIVFADGKICCYDKRNFLPTMMHIDYGLGVISQASLALIPDNQVYDLATFYTELVKKDQLAGFEVAERFYEIGSHEGIAELDSLLR